MVRQRGGATHTFAILELSPSAYAEIKGKLESAGYGHAFDIIDGREVIDMHGIAVSKDPDATTEASTATKPAEAEPAGPSNQSSR
jgi:hypothetical protein